MTLLEELTDTIGRVADATGPAVVAIGHGAGVVIADGAVLTNAHNLRGHDPRIVFADGREARGDVAGTDVDGDLAVVSVDTGDVAAVTWADDPAPRLGQPVVALSNPRGRGLVATMGTIAATDRAFRGPGGRLITGAVDHTAPLPRGSSGGPVVTVDGGVLGINTHRRGDGLYVAVVATDEVRQRIDALRAGERVSRPRLGVAVAPARVARRLRAAVGLDDRPGLLVRDVDEDGPAGRAGVQRGDLIVAADGEPVEHSDALFAVLGRLDGDASLHLTVVRGTEERTVAVTFGDTREEGSA